MQSSGNRKRHKSSPAGGAAAAAAAAAGSEGVSLPADSHTHDAVPAPLAELALGLDSGTASEEDDRDSSGLGALLEGWPSGLLTLGTSGILAQDALPQLQSLGDAQASSGQTALLRSSSAPQLPRMGVDACGWDAADAPAGGSPTAGRPLTPAAHEAEQDFAVPPPAGTAGSGGDLLPAGGSPTATRSREQVLAEALRRQRDMQQQLAASLEVWDGGLWCCGSCGMAVNEQPHRLCWRLHCMLGAALALGQVECERTRCSRTTTSSPLVVVQAQRALQLQLEAHGQYIEKLLK